MTEFKKYGHGNFKEAIEILNNLGAKEARIVHLNNSAGRRWIAYVDGCHVDIANGKLKVVRYANGDGFSGNRKVSVKKYAEAISAVGFQCEIKNNILYVNSKNEGK
jgi:hypothetical protein